MRTNSLLARLSQRLSKARARRVAPRQDVGKMFESLEDRRLLSVTSVAITSITAAGDEDGGLDLHATVQAGATGNVGFAFTVDKNTGAVVGEVSLIKSDTTTSVPVTQGSVVTPKSLTVGSLMVGSQEFIIPGNFEAGTYTLVLGLKQGGSDFYTDTEADAIVVVGSVTVTPAATPAVTVTAVNTTYNGSAYSGASITTISSGAQSYTYYLASAPLTALSGAPINAGDYLVEGNVAATTDYNANSSHKVPFTIAKASSTVTVTGGTFTYNGQTQTGGTAEVSGVGNGITQTVTWTYDGDMVNAGSYTATATYAGDDNHFGSSGSATITITKATLNADANVQSALDLAKQGTVMFKLSNVTGIVDDKSVADLLNGAAFTLKMVKSVTDGSVVYESLQFVATASVDASGDVHVGIKMAQTSLSDGDDATKEAASLLAFLTQGLDTGETSASKASVESITLSATSNGGNYAISEDVLTRIFSTVKK